MSDFKTQLLVVGVLVLLGAATGVAYVLKRRIDSGLDPAIVETFWVRIRAWWVLCSVLAGAFLLGPVAVPATVILFGLIAFWALREFITLTPTRPADHRTLFWVFFICTPVQFVLVGIDWYGLYSILIPVYVFLLIPTQIALSGDPKRFLERSAKIMAGLLICVYCLSHAPALLMLDLPEDPTGEGLGANLRLLFFFVLMVQLSDVSQYACGQMAGKHLVAPEIHPTRTWEGLIGGTAVVTLIGGALWWATPFQGKHWWMAAVMSLVISVMGFAGAMTMSAVKRDRGVKDYGTLVEGHGGVLDRIDSLCFAAPIFFHFTRFFLIQIGAMDPAG